MLPQTIVYIRRLLGTVAQVLDSNSAELMSLAWNHRQARTKLYPKSQMTEIETKLTVITIKRDAL